VEEAWAFTLFLLGILLMVNLYYYETRIKELLMALSDDLNLISDQLEKAKSEVTGKIGELEGALASAGEQPQEVADAVAALKQVAQGLDDVVADVPVVAPVEAPAPVEDIPAPVEDIPAPVEDIPAPVEDVAVPADVPAPVDAPAGEAVNP
jgi:hypothetical protein